MKTLRDLDSLASLHCYVIGIILAEPSHWAVINHEPTTFISIELSFQ